VTFEERVQAVANHGFTERQAGFLTTVMLHGGVCLGRQYCAYAGIARGQKVHDFFSGLVANGYATAYPRAHRKTHLYHVHAKTLYRAIGEPNNRHRRPVPLPAPSNASWCSTRSSPTAAPMARNGAREGGALQPRDAAVPV